MSSKASNFSNLPNSHDKTTKEKHDTQPVVNGAINHNAYDAVPYMNATHIPLLILII